MYSKNERKSTILYEVMDSHLDNYSDRLFFHIVDEISNNYEKEFNIKINSSLKIMNYLFQRILVNKTVECIYLDFKNNEKIVDIKINSLSNYISGLYIEEGYFTPVISMRITK